MNRYYYAQCNVNGNDSDGPVEIHRFTSMKSRNAWVAERPGYRIRLNFEDAKCRMRDCSLYRVFNLPKDQQIWVPVDKHEILYDLKGEYSFRGNALPITDENVPRKGLKVSDRVKRFTAAEAREAYERAQDERVFNELLEGVFNDIRNLASEGKLIANFRNACEDHVLDALEVELVSCGYEVLRHEGELVIGWKEAA